MGAPGRVQRHRIIPALAGNTSYPTTVCASITDHPRSRGEYVVGGVVLEDVEGSSPLSRGILMLRIMVNLKVRIIPALAGNTMCARALL